MITVLNKISQRPVVAVWLIGTLALAAFTDACSKREPGPPGAKIARPADEQAQAPAPTAVTPPPAGDMDIASVPKGPPKILSTSPAVGETDVDPALAEITVTFDRDMAGGFSWTGGGPDFPPSPEGQRASWRDKRTCALPVKLEAAHYYRVGINSMSYRGFRSEGGVPADPSAIYFTTQGASDALKLKTSKPAVVGLAPRNGAQDVDPKLTEIRVTFSVPMGGGFSWTGGGPEYPATPSGKAPYWTDDKKTCVLPVELQPGHNYRLGLNSVSHKNFQSVGGVPLDPVNYAFRTRE